jgi:hypothetical protein
LSLITLKLVHDKDIRGEYIVLFVLYTISDKINKNIERHNLLMRKLIINKYEIDGIKEIIKEIINAIKYVYNVLPMALKEPILYKITVVI